MDRKSAFESKYPDLAAELLKYIEPPPAPKRGRPVALKGHRLRQFFMAMAETLSKNKALNSGSRITAFLKKRPEYAQVSERTLRRWVKAFIDDEISRLKKTPIDDWRKDLGISPPTGPVKPKLLREKAFELMRRDLRPHE